MEKKCIDCKKLISKKAIRCQSCAKSGKFNNFFGVRCFGKDNPMYGKHNQWGNHSKETIAKMCGKTDSKAHNWKGDEAGYAAIHIWVKKNKPKAIYCELCNKKKSLDLANISGKYKRDIDDYQWLCRSCHKFRDTGKIMCPKCQIKPKYKTYNYCRECSSKYYKDHRNKQYEKKYYKNNIEKIKEYRKKYYKNILKKRRQKVSND